MTALAPGTRLGPYEIIDKIGAGGMGEVYRARDPRLSREVALKLLPEALANDADRLARLRREAQLLASLDHPHIAAIHGIEESQGKLALVLEFVQGETLAERLGRGAIPIEEALAIARQIAEGLEAAHEKGIIHRDLKPANVKVRPDGGVKLLDFGLARVYEEGPASESGAALTQSPTMSVRMTEAGHIVGTAAYMSPEQARGKPLDKRSDIWAYGVVLYEMLAGRRLFQGETVSDTLAAVLRAEMDLAALPAATSSSILKLLARCLDRDPRQRLRDIGEARVIIERVIAGTEEGEVVREATAERRRGRALMWLALAACVAAVGVALGWGLRPPASEPPLRKFLIPAPDVTAARISPDGRSLVYAAKGKLWIRELDRLDARELPAAKQTGPLFWSSDGAWVGYGAMGKLWKIPAAGGQPLVLCELPDGAWYNSAGGAWGADQTIIFTTGGTGLRKVSAQGGDQVSLLEPDPKTEEDYHDVSPLPDGRGVVFVVHRLGGEEAIDTIAVDADGEKKDVLTLEGQGLSDPVWSPTGHILYRRAPLNRGIWALPFSLSRLEATGESFLVVPEGSNPSIASDGTLTYLAGASEDITQLVWLDRRGEAQGTIGQPQVQWPYPSLSPDGRRVAVAAGESTKSDIWIHDPARGTKTRLTSSGLASEPNWSPRGDRIVYSRGHDPSDFRIHVMAADGTGETHDLGMGFFPAYSPDGKYLVYTMATKETSLDISYLPLEGEPKPIPFLRAPADEGYARVSPDGRSIAYLSNESGQDEVYLKRFPGGEGKWQVSVDGGYWPRWNGKGDRLFYTKDNDIFEVEVAAAGDSIALSTPRKLFTRKPLRSQIIFNWPPGFDVTPDGERFVVAQNLDEKHDEEGIAVVQSWFAEFKGKH